MAGSLRDSNAEARIHLLRLRCTIDGRQEHLIPMSKLWGANRSLRAVQESGSDIFLRRLWFPRSLNGGFFRG